LSDDDGDVYLEINGERVLRLVVDTDGKGKIQLEQVSSDLGLKIDTKGYPVIEKI